MTPKTNGKGEKQVAKEQRQKAEMKSDPCKKRKMSEPLKAMMEMIYHEIDI